MHMHACTWRGLCMRTPMQLRPGGNAAVTSLLCSNYMRAMCIAAQMQGAGSYRRLAGFQRV
jgi:hypothetical protein